MGRKCSFDPTNGDGEGGVNPVFLIDITCEGNGVPTETVFVRRPFLHLGSHESCHLAIPEMEGVGFSLEVTREVGRRFQVTTRPTKHQETPTFVGGAYNASALIEIGPVTLGITALDVDLLLKEQEALDKAGIRILRRAFSEKAAEYPAVKIKEPFVTTISLWPNQSLSIGRARSSSIRLDVPTVSMQHARLGYESGEFWIEDLGSTNGTFIEDVQISSRKTFKAGQQVWLSKSACLVGILAEDGASRSADSTVLGHEELSATQQEYPVLVSLSEAARPSRLVLQAGREFKIGRDPSCGLWLGAPHISRNHCGIRVSSTGLVSITDSSTNGTAFDRGVLRDGEVFETKERPLVLNFGGGVTVGLCFSKEQEDLFAKSSGSPDVFLLSEKPESEAPAQPSRGNSRERRNTTWFNIDAVVLDEEEEQLNLRAKIYAISKGLTLYGRIAVVALALCFLVMAILMGGMLFSALRW